MMKVAIIDCQAKRRCLIEEWLRSAGHEVVASERRGILSSTSQADLLLLHVGVNQEPRASQDILRESVGAILAEFSHTCWTIGYSGGAIADAAMHQSYPRYARYRPQVAGDDFPIEMRNVLLKVLKEIGGSNQLSEKDFQSIIAGFDPILEIELQALATILAGKTVEGSTLQELYKGRPDAFDLEKNNLRGVPGDRVASARILRDIFFGCPQ